jgi:hypothetical protein
MNTARRRLAVVAVVLAASTTSGCANLFENRKSERGRGDTGVAHIDGTKAWVIEMPDGFSNIATKCVWEGVRALSGTGGGKGVAVIADPSCEQPDYSGPSR